MIEMNPYAIMRMTIDTLKPSSPDLGTCFISTLGESEIDTLTLGINMRNHRLPQGAQGDGKGFASAPRGGAGPLLFPTPWVPFWDFIYLCLYLQWNLMSGEFHPPVNPCPDAVHGVQMCIGGGTHCPHPFVSLSPPRLWGLH